MATDRPTFTETRSLGQMTSQLIDNLSLLVEKQIDLAKQEVQETIRGAIAVLKMFGPALAVALLFVIALITLLIAAVALGLNALLNNPLLSLLLSAVIFTVLFLIITGILAYVGYRRLQRMLEHPMGNTLDSIQEDVEWAKRQLRPSER